MTEPSEPASVEVIGLDHLYVAVSDLSRSVAFYDPVMAALGFKKGDREIAGEPHAHYFNRVLQYTLRPARRQIAHDPYTPGLHHLCFQVRDRAAVDSTAQRLRALDIAVTEASEYPEYSPDYYAIFFRDPDGLRLEIVARTAARDTIAERWSDLEGFLNPVARLREREERG